MDIKFLGRGSAFNPNEGNTSAFFIEDDELFLIDCGETVFSKLIEKNIFNSINTVNVLITHTHSDHIGSLGTLVLYCYNNIKGSLNIIVDENVEYISDIEKLLFVLGCPKDSYNYVYTNSINDKYKSFSSIKFTPTLHVDNLNCYSIIFNTKDGLVFYSGDTRETKVIEKILNKKIDKIYVDTNSNKTGSHLCIDKLNEIIPDKVKEKIYCMHINDDKCINKAKDYGFKIVDLVK